MGKKGPCLHCGVTSTPLWRNGPGDKPVLCNACGSRYKSRGNLDNYLPKNVQNKLRLTNDNNSHSNDDTSSNLSNVDKLSDSDDYGDGSSQSPPRGGGNNPDLLTSKIPSKKRSRVEYKEEEEEEEEEASPPPPPPPMKKFHKDLLTLYRKSNPDEFPPEDGTLIDNVNNFIPSNEISHGAILLKPPPPPPPPADDDAAPMADNNNDGSSTCTSNN